MAMTREEKNAKRRAYRAAHKEERKLKRKERRKIFRMLHKDEYEAEKIKRNINDRQKRAKISKEHPRTYKIVAFSGSLHIVIPYRIADELNIHKGDGFNITTDGVRIFLDKV